MFWDFRFPHMAWASGGSVQEGAPGPSRPVDDFFGQDLEIVAVIGVLCADDLHGAGPAAPDADHLVAFAQRADGHGADGWIQSRNITPAGEDPDHAAFLFNVWHK